MTHVWVHGDDLVDFRIADDVVTTTEDHPFWNATDGTWQGPGEFDAGDRVLTVDGNLLVTAGLVADSWHTGSAYNLTVDGIHTYYVVVADEAVLVHNTGAACDVADQIANGHAYTKHADEYPEISTPSEFAAQVRVVIDDATDVRVGLDNGRTAFWRDDSIVILDPMHPDGGTMFRPTDGYDYFLNQVR